MNQPIPEVVVAGLGQAGPKPADDRSIAEMVLAAVQAALSDAQLGYADLDAVVTASVDLFDGLTASNIAVTEVVGAVMKPETRIAGDGLAAAVLTAPDSIAWLLNVRGGDVDHSPLPLSFAILHASGEVELFASPEKLGPETRRHLGNGVRPRPPTELAAGLAALEASSPWRDAGTRAASFGLASCDSYRTKRASGSVMT